MFKLRVLAPILFILLAGSVAAAGLGAGQEPAQRMTLEACLVRALEKNLDLRIQILDPRIADAGVTRAAEKFLPTLSFGIGAESNRSASFSFLDAAENVISRFDNYQAQLRQELPTGGTISASLTSYKSETNRNFQSINPRYGSQLLFAFSQPLLRGFGYRVPRKEILIAQQSRDQAEDAAKKAVLDTLYAAETAYWDLVFAVEDLEVKRQSVGLARNLLERNRREREIGMLAPIEVVSAEAEVAAREADILQAEALVKSREDALRNLLDMRTPAGETPAPLIPADAPAPEAPAVSVESALAAALSARPELLSARTGVRSKDLELTYARNQLLPDLSLNLSYWSPGVSGTQILYQDDNPFSGVVVGTIAGQAADAMKDAFRFRYKNWNAGLTLTVPLSTVLTRAAAAQAGFDVERARLELEKTEQQIILEVRDAVRDVETNAKRVAAYAAALRLAEQKLEGEERKVKVGLSTNYTLLQVQRDLATAKSLHLRARIDSALSQARLDKAMGASLERRNIHWTSPLEK
jgi:outer membrane protein TolC